jgi:hypothetical protein
LLQLAIAANETVRRSIVAKIRFRFALEFRNNPVGEHFPELHAPLVKRIDAPNRALGKNIVLVEGDEFAKGRRCKFLDEDGIDGRLPSKTR